MQLQFIKLSSLFLILLSFSVHANDLTLDMTGNNGTLNVIQDGQDNSIDMSASSWLGGNLELKQIGDNNTIDVDVIGGTGSGSILNIYQTGDNKSYSNSLSCDHTWCELTVTQ